MRFDTLDGLRGVAAILVLFYHLGGSAPISAPAGYLAVDLFFALSGFVLAHAYEERLRQGLPLGEFAVLRLIRVYPMALIGAAIGVLLSHGFVPSLLLLPDIGGAGALYPANVPLWSLASELVVNLAFAAVALHVGWRGLAAILIASGGIVVIGTSIYGLGDLGPFWNSAGFGLARTVFSFAIGVAIRRFHTRFGLRRRRTHLAWGLPVALFIAFAAIPGDDMKWELVSIFVLLPALLWLGTLWEAPDPRLFGLLGALSYPLYCIHGVIVQAFNAADGPPAYLWAVLILAAWWLNSRIDEPLRAWLLLQWKSRRFVLRPGLEP